MKNLTRFFLRAIALIGFVMLLTTVGMDSNGQFRIASLSDKIIGLDNIDNTSDLNKPLSIAMIAALLRTTSASTLSLVGSGATGTQISSNKDSSISYNVSTSTTSTIGGPLTSIVTLKICSTNSATEGDWSSIALLENDQTITLALALQSIQIFKGQLGADLPAGWFVKLVNSGTGTHSEAFISGQKTIYG